METLFENRQSSIRWDECLSAAALPEDKKEFLFSEGSLTLHLEKVLGSPVEVEVSRTAYSTLGPDEASYLEESPHQESMEREVWLKAGGKRLVYAQTLIPVSCMEKDLMEVLKQGGEPLGRILSTKNIAFTKDKLEVGIVRCREAARDLGIDSERPLFARRYRLMSRKSSGKWNIKASVTEVFSPELVCAGG